MASNNFKQKMQKIQMAYDKFSVKMKQITEKRKNRVKETFKKLEQDKMEQIIQHIKQL